jgi:AraC-like DNA-binding protein
MFWLHRNPPPLGQFVELFWYWESAGCPGPRERLLPSGTMELIVDLDPSHRHVRTYKDEHSAPIDLRCSGVVCGIFSGYFVIDSTNESNIVGVHFKAGGAYPFFRLPAGELRDQHIALDDLWGNRAREVRERLLAAPNPDQKLRVMECCLLEQMARPLERNPAVGFALATFRGAPLGCSVGKVTEKIGYSQRHFIAMFNDEVGLTPKVYFRIERFQKLLRRIHTAPAASIDWTEVALDCGYFDQAHFIRDFRAFSGLSPTAYLQQRSEHLNHVPIPEPKRGQIFTIPRGSPTLIS